MNKIKLNLEYVFRHLKPSV